MAKTGHGAIADAPRDWPMARHQLSGRFFELVFELIDVRLQFFGRGQTAEVELQHFPGAFGWLLAGPEADEQAGDDPQVDLDGEAVSAGGQEMLATEDTLEPTEEQLDEPSILPSKIEIGRSPVTVNRASVAVSFSGVSAAVWGRFSFAKRSLFSHVRGSACNARNRVTSFPQHRPTRSSSHSHPDRSEIQPTRCQRRRTVSRGTLRCRASSPTRHSCACNPWRLPSRSR